MEFLTSLLKALVLLPVWALVESPFIQLSTRIVVPRRLSFRAAYMLALLSGGALILANVILWPVFANVGDLAGTAISATVALALSTAIYGYFLTNAEGKSVGYLKGGLVVLVSVLLASAALVAFAFLVVGVVHVWKT